MAMRRNILFYIKLVIPYEEKCLLSGSCVQNVFGKVMHVYIKNSSECHYTY